MAWQVVCDKKPRATVNIGHEIGPVKELSDFFHDFAALRLPNVTLGTRYAG